MAEWQTRKTDWTLNPQAIGNADLDRMEATGQSIIDPEGNYYDLVQIGSQLWTAQNLKVTVYNDGTTPIPEVTDNAAWLALTDGAYCKYDNTHEFGGLLYNYFAVAFDNVNKIAPPGWRVANRDDWGQLFDYLAASGYNWDRSVTPSDRTKIAESLASQQNWLQSTGAGRPGNSTALNNLSRFNALPVGERDGGSGLFENIGLAARFWAPQSVTPFTTFSKLDFSDPAAEILATTADNSGFSVRLIKIP